MMILFLSAKVFVCTINFLVFFTLSLSLCLLVIQSLVALVQDPEPEHPLRGDLAEEYTKDRKKFMKNAEEFTRKYGEPIPKD